MKTIILGLGNPLFGDDGAGCRVARALRRRVKQEDIDIEEFSGAGLDIPELIQGYDKAIIIDAIQNNGGEIGKIHHLDWYKIASLPAGQSHQMDFIRALKMAVEAGQDTLPNISIYAIEAGEINRVKTGCSPAVQAAIPVLVETIIRELNN
jgi:hydrogenase maturation protease